MTPRPTFQLLVEHLDRSKWLAKRTIYPSCRDLPEDKRRELYPYLADSILKLNNLDMAISAAKQIRETRAIINKWHMGDGLMDDALYVKLMACYPYGFNVSFMSFDKLYHCHSTRNCSNCHAAAVEKFVSRINPINGLRVIQESFVSESREQVESELSKTERRIKRARKIDKILRANPAFVYKPIYRKTHNGVSRWYGKLNFIISTTDDVDTRGKYQVLNADTRFAINGLLLSTLRYKSIKYFTCEDFLATYYQGYNTTSFYSVYQ